MESDMDSDMDTHILNMIDSSMKSDTFNSDTNADKLHKRTPEYDYTPNGRKKIPITKSGAFVKFEYLSSNLQDAIKLAKKIENYFTLRSQTITGHIQQLKCCKMDKTNKRIIVPRFGVFELLNNKFGLNAYSPISQIKTGQAPSQKFVWNGTQTDNQKILSELILTKYYSAIRVKNGSAGVIVNLEAGQGKSYLAAYIISILQKKTAIILHTTALIDQWVTVLQNALGSDVKIGFYYCKKKKDGDIMLLIIDSAAHDTFHIDDKKIDAISFYNQFGFIVYDECHTYANKMALKAIKSAQAPYMMGLSATPDEHALGYDSAIWWSIGPVLDAKTVPGYVATSENFTGTVHRMMYYGPEKYTKHLVDEIRGMMMISATVNMICEDPYRDQLVINCIIEGLSLGLNMFVFADRRTYLSKLQNMLTKQYSTRSDIITSNEEFVRIVGGDKNEELEKAERLSRVILTTYQYMGTGKSVVKMNGLVLATPRKTKMKQYINRIFRLGSDMKIRRHIYDICDMRLKFGRQWCTRKTYYTTKKYEIEETKIKYPDIELCNINDKPNGTDLNDKPNGTNLNDKPNGTNLNDKPNGTDLNDKPNGTDLNDKPNGTDLNDKPNGTDTEKSPCKNAVTQTKRTQQDPKMKKVNTKKYLDISSKLLNKLKSTQ